MYKVIYALIVILLASYSANSFAQTYNGNHTFYFDDRNNKAIEVYYKGSYEYDYSKRKWRPSKGSYSFTAICVHQYSCNTRYEAEKNMMDFKTALLNNALYTISFETSPGECLPGKPCTHPLSKPPVELSSTLAIDDTDAVYTVQGSARRKSADKSTSLSEDFKNYAEGANTAIDAFKKVFDSKKDKLNFVIITSAKGKFKNACYISEDGVCKEEVEVTENGSGFSAEFRYDPSNEVEKNFFDMLDDMFINKPKYQCVGTRTCSILTDGNMQCI